MYDAADARPPAAQLHRVAAQLCAGVIARRCEGVDGPGRPCKQRATHGPPHGEATLCADHVDAWDARIADIKGDGPPSVLDVASAAGEPAVSIARLLPQATVHATDYSPGMVEALNTRVAVLRETEGLANVHTGVADGESDILTLLCAVVAACICRAQNLSQFEDASMDAITCSFGIMFMPAWQKAIREFYRVLKPNGIAIINVWGPEQEAQRCACIRLWLLPQHNANDVRSRIRPPPQCHLVSNSSANRCPGLLQRSPSHMPDENITHVFVITDFKVLLNPCSLGGGHPHGQHVVDEMQKAGFVQMQHMFFEVQVAAASLDEAWHRHLLGTPFAATLQALERQGRPRIHADARALFETLVREGGWVAEDGTVRITSNKAIMFAGRKM
ncbi:S-adenosyl-L-methionine-dependent methyltransferase [Tribonema minus]|uniref:S-adenosyl-L-methionine-dependent methyltransferase n=1 Tax=Tribonema minus TaxID=303371 RepID=A0A835YPT1_9STRA|nr:S-adenosyl-L-methionine-dependent methyltransferase [Tribonema minus]